MKRPDPRTKKRLLVAATVVLLLCGAFVAYRVGQQAGCTKDKVVKTDARTGTKVVRRGNCD